VPMPKDLTRASGGEYGDFRVGGDGARRGRVLPADTPPLRRAVRVGISVLTWLIWLAASELLLIYCVLRREFLLSGVQGVNIAAIATTILLVRRSNRICPYHRERAVRATRR
jgi:hypothetical protein